MQEYEFVPKSEYQPVRIELEKIIKAVQDIVRDDFTFQFKLVGSGGRHLITRIKGGNQGFDFDYNLILNNPDEEHFWKPEFAKETLMKAFQQAIKGTKYNKVENSKSAITIKVVDKKNSKIVHSCDFAVIYYPINENYFKYVRANKNVSPIKYTWEIRNSSVDIDYKLEQVLANYNWSTVKAEYLDVKNANKDEDKHSFQLYLEAINNIYNWMNNRPDDYDDEDEEYY